MPKKRLPAIANRAVWEKVTKGRAGIRWDSVVEKVWKDVGGNQEEILSIEKFQDRRKDRNTGKASAKKQGERGGTLKRFTGVKRRNRNENVFARPNGLRENAESAISVRGPGPAERRKRYTSSREEGDAQMCPCGKAIEYSHSGRM